MPDFEVCTARLRLYPIGDDEMRAMIAAEPDPEMKGAYGEMLAGCLMKPAERQGYTTEAVAALTRWALAQTGISRVEAEIEPDNTASRRVLEKAGFAENGVMGEEGPRFVWAGDAAQ